ncbi:hypothetical protein C427_4264 [Paraglaciecola psychrophila 170]|jgi:hypothetical protein|uniref:Uncharacterized protein n=1 Tax=Paraglaciecola psychrophila 170 TaxID=1129794 RepID=M4RVX5_9ALTE|nr:hypothetical protein C427_4264 [Paraglaciecola psychrophila 170]
MRNLNEYVARETNKEDKCTGSFIRHYPWRSPLGPAKAVLIYFR